jgi:hypothetical protein
MKNELFKWGPRNNLFSLCCRHCEYFVEIDEDRGKTSSRSSRNCRICCYSLDWCSDLRKKLIIVDSFVVFPPQDSSEFIIWCNALNLEVDEYKPSMRVCLHHFYIEDYLPFEEIGVLKFILRRDGLTRASSDRLGRNSGNRKAPPRPIAPPAQYSNDFFFFNSKVKTRTVESFLFLFPDDFSFRVKRKIRSRPLQLRHQVKSEGYCPRVQR